MTSDRFQIKIKMPNPSQEPAAFSKALDEDLRDMDVLCTFKINFGTCMYQRTVTIYKSRLRFQTPVRNLQHSPKLKMLNANHEFPISFKAQFWT